MTTTSTLLKGKHGIAFGVSSSRSIAYAVANAWLRHGADSVTIVCKDASVKARLKLEPEKFAYATCDVTKEDEVRLLFSSILRSGWSSSSPSGPARPPTMLLHSVAYSPAARAERISDITAQDFLDTMHVSAYSLISLARHAGPLLEVKGSSLLSLTFLGSTRRASGYDAMGPSKAALESVSRYLAFQLGETCRVNCVSPGPINTPAARGLRNFHELSERAVSASASKRAVTQADVAGVCVALCSEELSGGVTGQVIHVDGGMGVGVC